MFFSNSESVPLQGQKITTRSRVVRLGRNVRIYRAERMPSISVRTPCRSAMAARMYVVMFTTLPSETKISNWTNPAPQIRNPKSEVGLHGVASC
jgi:hypothetical protein